MRKIYFSSLLVLSLFIFTSCSGIMGYGVMLWNLPESGLRDGDIVPVYIKSNISHEYVIGTETGKVGIPLWQLSEPTSKLKAKKNAQKYQEYLHKYAYVALDGLPMRAEPVNTAKQVYRLRKNETIKVLYKGEGQAVMAGRKPLEGNWLRVLTSDGTQGWCFSYNLRIYETDALGKMIGENNNQETENVSTEVDELLTKNWYPESYHAMIKTGRIDVTKLIPSHKFVLDNETKKLTFNMPKLNLSWNYVGSEKKGYNQYSLKEIPIIITVKNSSFIVVRYTGPDGKPEDFNLVAIDGDLNELVQKEKERRNKEYEQIYMFGPSFKSSNYGQLKFSEDKTFVWTNNRLLVPAVISSSASNKGTVSVKYFLSRTLSAAYDGVLSFKFNGMTSEVNFLYKMEESGLRLEDATGAVISNNTITERGLSPLVLFFTKGE